MHETFEHTADLGLRIVSPDLDTLFAEAGEALFAAIIDNLGEVRHSQKVDLRIEGDDRAFLLFDWLRELLYRYDGEHMVFCRFEAHVTADGLTGAAWGEPLDFDRHVPLHEVKAITYHHLRVEQTGAGWLAEVIVDI